MHHSDVNAVGAGGADAETVAIAETAGIVQVTDADNRGVPLRRPISRSSLTY